MHQRPSAASSWRYEEPEGEPNIPEGPQLQYAIEVFRDPSPGEESEPAGATAPSRTQSPPPRRRRPTRKILAKAKERLQRLNNANSQSLADQLGERLTHVHHCIAGESCGILGIGGAPFASTRASSAAYAAATPSRNFFFSRMARRQARLWPGHAAVWHSLPQKDTPRHPRQRLLAPVLPQYPQVLIPTEARAALMFSRLSMVVGLGGLGRRKVASE